MIYLGIDPGLDGALVVLNGSGAICAIYDTPTLTVEGKGKTRREYAVNAMAELLKFGGERRAALELVHAMPGQGVRSMFSMGVGVGVWQGLLAGLGIPYQTVTPQRWKKALMDGMGKDKDASRLTAMRLFPSASGQLQRKKDDGRADALLIAEWLRRQFGAVSAPRS